MIELLSAVDKSGTIESSCFLEGKNIVVSSFSAQQKNYETIAKQAFSYIFLNVAKVKTKHDEAHLEVGDKRLSAFLLKPSLVLVCLSAKDASLTQVRNHIKTFKHDFLQAEVERMLA